LRLERCDLLGALARRTLARRTSTDRGWTGASTLPKP